MTNYLITGAGRGIGLEMTKQALAAGHSVIGSVRPGADAALLDLATDSGGSLGIITFDVRQPETIAAAATALDRPIDVLVNNAGIIGHQPQSTSDMDFDGFSDTLAVNTLGPLRVVHAFLPHLRRGNRPRIVTISSKMGSFS
ncbi:MAG: SDR family NAD(P)-dependent oxidoreductase, partial [Pseudomonadota bacterium]